MGLENPQGKRERQKEMAAFFILTPFLTFYYVLILYDFDYLRFVDTVEISLPFSYSAGCSFMFSFASASLLCFHWFGTSTFTTHSYPESLSITTLCGSDMATTKD